MSDDGDGSDDIPPPTGRDDAVGSQVPTGEAVGSETPLAESGGVDDRMYCEQETGGDNQNAQAEIGV